MPGPLRRQLGKKRLGHLADFTPTDSHRQCFTERRAAVTARPKAVIAPQHYQPRAGTHPIEEQRLLRRVQVAAVQIADDKNVERVDRLAFVRQRIERNIVHVRPLQEHVRPGLHESAEFQVGVFRQKAIDNRPVFRPQGPLNVEHTDARLDDHGGGRTGIVLLDSLLADRRHADGVTVAAFDGRPKLKEHLLRGLRFRRASVLFLRSVGRLPPVSRERPGPADRPPRPTP